MSESHGAQILYPRRFWRKLPKPLKVVLLALWGAVSVLISGVISSLLYDFLIKDKTSFLPVSIADFLDLKFSINQIVWILIVFSIPFLLFIRFRQRDVMRYKSVLSRVRQRRSSSLGALERNLTEFIFDILQGHLDTKLSDIVEQALKSDDKQGHSFVSGILQGLKSKYFSAYFEFEPASIHLFRPDKFGEYLAITDSVPPSALSEEQKDSLRFYVGQATTFHRKGLAGFAFKEQKLQKVHINQDRQAFLIDFNKDQQAMQEKSFPEYVNLKENELTYIKSSAAVPVILNHNNHSEVLGVMCVDWTEREIFKSHDHDEELFKAALCLAIALEIQRLLKKLH